MAAHEKAVLDEIESSRNGGLNHVNTSLAEGYYST